MAAAEETSDNTILGQLLGELQASKHAARLQPEDRADVCQVVIQLVWQRYRGKPEDQLRKIAFRVQQRLVDRLLVQQAKSDERLKRLSLRIQSPQEAMTPTEFEMARAEFRRALVECLLPGEQELVLTVFLRCRSLRDAARQLRMPESTLRVSLQRALAKLRERLSSFPDLAGSMLAGELQNLGQTEHDAAKHARSPEEEAGQEGFDD